MARKIVVILGFFIAILPYLGFPEHVDTTLYTVCGLLVLFLAWSGKRTVDTVTIEELEHELKEFEEDHPINRLGENHAAVAAANPMEVVAETVTVGEAKNESAVVMSFEKRRERKIKKPHTQVSAENAPPTP